jgi:hypothetical protein
MAISTERVCSTLAPRDAISSISSYAIFLQPPRLGNDARIGRIDAVDIGIDVAAVGLQGRRNGDRARVRAAAAEGRDAVVGRDALEAGDHRHLPLRQPLVHQGRIDPASMRAEPCMAEVAPESASRARIARSRRWPISATAEQPGRDLLACRHHDVVFARVMQRRQLAGPADKLVGLARHGRDHHRDLVAALDLALDQGPPRGGCDRDRRPTCRRIS